MSPRCDAVKVSCHIWHKKLTPKWWTKSNNYLLPQVTLCSLSLIFGCEEAAGTPVLVLPPHHSRKFSQTDSKWSNLNNFAKKAKKWTATTIFVSSSWAGPICRFNGRTTAPTHKWQFLFSVKLLRQDQRHETRQLIVKCLHLAPLSRVTYLS